jgi:hypothetical protein
MAVLDPAASSLVSMGRAAVAENRVLRVDAHADYPDRYCKRLLEVQTRTRADSVVVGMHTAGHSGSYRTSQYARADPAAALQKGPQIPFPRSSGLCFPQA